MKLLINPGHIAQSVTCLATDVCQTADPGVTSSIPGWSHTFVEIDHEIISSVYKRKYVHEALVKPLFKLAREKSVVR